MGRLKKTYSQTYQWIKCLFLFTALVVSSFTASAQYYSTGSDPGNTKWNSITTNSFKIIYPQQIDSLAFRYADLLEQSMSQTRRLLGISNKRISVILHPFNVNSNGFVVWAPKRVELVTSPPSSGGYSQNWETQLAVHETRHIGQMRKFEKGVFKPLSWIIGEQAQGIGAGVYLNQWEMEGDAVVSETESTMAGRGRDPSFLMFYKAAFLNGDRRSLIEWSVGSIRNFEPDVYSFGYLMNSNIRLYSGNLFFFGDMINYRINHFYNPLVIGKSYKSASGMMNKAEFYNSFTRMLESKWKLEDTLKGEITKNRPITKVSKTYTSYRSVVEISNNSRVALKSSLDQIPSLIFLDTNGRETFLTHVGNIQGSLASHGAKVFWAESIKSKRWEQESFSVLVAFDLQNNKKRYLTTSTKLFNPTISTSGDTLCAVEYPIIGGSNLIFFSCKDFREIKRIKSFGGEQIRELLWIGDDIFCTVVNQSGLSLKTVNVKDCKWKQEIFPQSRSISRVCSFKNDIIFESDLNGTNNIYCYEIESKQVYRLTNSRFGAFDPFFSQENNSIYYSDFNTNGYNLVKTKIEDLCWIPSDFSRPFEEETASVLSKQAGYINDTIVNKKVFVPKKYIKVANLFKFHSWAPLYYDLDKLKTSSYQEKEQIVSAGFIALSQNELSTANAMVGYSYSNGFHAGHMKFSYTGFYPVFDFKLDINERNSEKARVIRDGNISIQHIDTIRSNPYFDAKMLVYLPINYSRSGWTHFLIPQLSWRYTNDSFFSLNLNKYSDYQQLSVGVQYYKFLNLAKRNIFPKLGYGVNLLLTKIPFSGENFGTLFYLGAYAYIPGAYPNHGLKISAKYQYQFISGKTYLQNNAVAFPRGYYSYPSKKMYYLSFDYVFPIYFGDFAFAHLLYIKRLQIIPFGDWGRSYGPKSNINMLSVGSDILADFHVLGIPLALNGGIRYARTAENRNFFQLIFKAPF